MEYLTVMLGRVSPLGVEVDAVVVRIPYIKNLLNSCLRFPRCLQFESATLHGPLMSDASQLLPLI